MLKEIYKKTMIEKGLFRIIDLFSNNINIFYNNIDKYFNDQLIKLAADSTSEINESVNPFESFIKNLITYLSSLGFSQENLENNLIHPLIKELNYNRNEINKIILLNKKSITIIRELFLNQICMYLADGNSVKIMSHLNSNGFLPIEFIIDLDNLKKSFEKSLQKKENLKNYLQIREKVVQKLSINKHYIESLKNIIEPFDKLQFSYLIYKIIAFLDLQHLFDFTNIKQYIENDISEWLNTIPLVSLNNPELYYCGIYLAKRLSVKIDEDMVKYFLLDIYDESIDEFESPVFEATNKVYYFLKTSKLVNLELSELQIKELLKDNPKFFESNYLKNLETSRLVIILKIYEYFGYNEKSDSRKINSIIKEIDRRINENGIKQYRDGFISSEAIYHFLLSYRMRNNLKSLKNYNFLDNIITRIFRNLEICDLTKETNLDLISEVYYSLKCLKLLNCINTEQMINLFGKHLFPDEIIVKVLNNNNNNN